MTGRREKKQPQKGQIKAQMGVIYFADNCGPSDFALNESLDRPPVFFPEGGLRGGVEWEGGRIHQPLASLQSPKPLSVRQQSLFTQKGLKPRMPRAGHKY